MAAPSWKGAVKFEDYALHVALYNRVRSRSADSFKMLSPGDKKPVRSILVESGEYEKLEKDPHAKVLTIGRNDTLRGVPMGGDEYQPLNENSREAIAAAERSTVIEPARIVPRSTIPFDLTDKSLAVVPDKKVAASEASVDALWSYLHDEELAYVTEVTFRSGSRDSILVLYADDVGLLGVTVPFGTELNPDPDGFARNHVAGAQERLGAVAEDEGYIEDTFDFDQHESKYEQRRNAAIEAALKGKTPKVQPQVPQTTGKDLMSALESGIGVAPKKAKKARGARGGKKKPAAKRTAKKKVGA